MRAVIAAAGMGTRFFPIGKTINKCMLPIVDQPVIAYAVADCLAAGARDIAIVTAEGRQAEQVRHYFTEDPDMRDFFAAHGWQAKYEPIAHLHEQADFTFIEQPRDERYGTAIPAMLAADFIGDDDFLLIAGDDLLLRTDGGSDLADMVNARAAADTPAAVAAATVPGQDAHRYGILHARTSPDGHQLLDDLLEKPTDYARTSAYINISRTLLPGTAVPYFQKLTAVNGEYQATDAVRAFARDHDMLIRPITGSYHDCGNPAGWLAANNAAAQADPVSSSTTKA